MRTNRIIFALALAAGLVGFGTSVAQDKAKEKSGKSKTAAKDSAKKPEPITAIVGADVYTVTRGVVRGGTILVQDGKILNVGQDLAVPAGATVIDAAGKIVTPGFVAVSATGVGLRAGGGGPGGGGGGGPAARPARTAESLNPFDRSMLFCLGSGITTACVDLAAGGAGRFGRAADDELDDTRVCRCCGLAILPTEPITPTVPAERTPRRHAVLKMSYGDLAPMLVKEAPFYHLTAGALSGPLNRHRWRETIGKAKQYVKDQAAHEAAEEPTGGPPRIPVSEDVVKLVKKEIPLVIDASSADQLRDMVALAKELDYNLVIEDALEAWLVAGELGSAKASVVLTPRNRRRPQPGKEATTGSSIETSAALEKAGVPFAVATLRPDVNFDGAYAGRDVTSLALEAAFAVRGGCSEQTALAAMTIEPAKMLGIADRVGSIETGKDADLLILTGPPLDYRTYVEKALVAGKIYYDRAKDKIYPDTPGR
jgi:imidazolonepropionase-like amidohydrolase